MLIVWKFPKCPRGPHAALVWDPWYNQCFQNCAVWS